MIAHAVDRQAARLRGRIDHVASGAHAEGIDSSLVRSLPCKLVAGRPQFTAFLHAVLALIDQRLGMLYPQSHRECLWLHGDASGQQGLKGIPGAVSDGQHHCLRLKNLAAVDNKGFYAPGFPRLPLRHKIRYLALEEDLASQLFNLCPYGFDNAA